MIAILVIFIWSVVNKEHHPYRYVILLFTVHLMSLLGNCANKNKEEKIYMEYLTKKQNDEVNIDVEMEQINN